MVFDIPHMIVSGIIVLAVLWIVDHTSAFDNTTKGKKTLIKFGGIFVLILILNILWPYGSTT